MVNRMRPKKSRFITIGLILLSLTIESCGQSRQEKTTTIINKMNLVENQKTIYQFQLEALKCQAIGIDSIKILELEKKLTDEEIAKKINSAFDDVFSKKEINEIYKFIQSSAFEKFFNSGETYKVIASKFDDIGKEIKGINNLIREDIEIPIKKFKPIPTNKKNGFYTTVDYSYSTENKDIKLANKPSLTVKDILEAKKIIDPYGKQIEINIILTKDGTRKFYLMTKENIEKPIAIVLSKQIVSLPKVISEIISGRVSISGDFSEKEVDEMIAILNKK